MSFITKRERVFNEYDLLDLPSRNEGRLKAYASCTDARAWSHFCSDKTEHLVEIIKRNNETCRAKYVPTDVIVDTLMVAKNAEIARLKRRMEEYEHVVAAYDQLDLNCDQKCEIAKAHSAIKAANKELDDLCLNLDLSNFTEAMDSEGFQTGKSSGDDELFGKMMESKCNQIGELACICDASTNATDPRMDEMQEALIHKDAKLCAMQNTIAVMENDVCEPYCIYAHIYTALEKIFGVLCQNDKYRLYLDLLTSGKDTRCIDIKGRILYKLKVLEKFSLALVAPCSQEFREAQNDAETCACYHAEIVTHVQTTMALTSAETKGPSVDNKRAQLVAEIMEHDEMKEILGKENVPDGFNDDQTEDVFCVDDYNIETENLNRLKSLQVNYDELMTCYENLKHEKECLQIRCQKYDELEKDFLSLQSQMREYNTLWNEKEHYRRRSEDLDSLKGQYLVLTEETSNIETQLKAESEINYIKTGTIEELRNENIVLEQKLNESAMAFEKEKNALHCKLKETECKVMCQEQQIKSLSAQIDRLLEQDQDKPSQDHTSKSIAFIDEIESLRDQIKNLKDALYFSEEEKEQLQEQFQDKLMIINDLKMDIEDWRSTYEKTLQRNECLEKCADNFRDEMHRLVEENKKLSLDVEEKNTAVANLLNVINNKSQEMNKLIDENALKQKENKEILKQLREVRESYDINVMALEHEKTQVELVRQESRELLEKVMDYNSIVNANNDLSKSLKMQEIDCDELTKTLNNTLEDNKRLQIDLERRENNNAVLLQEIHRLREVNNYAVNNISNLEDEKNQYRTSLELTKKESKILEDKLLQFEDLRNQLQNLQESNERLINEKNKLESELRDKQYELNTAMCSIELTKKDSEDLMDKLHQSENLKEDFIKLSGTYHRLVNEKQCLQQELSNKNTDLENVLKTLITVKNENEELLNASQKVRLVSNELSETKKLHDELLLEKNLLQIDFDNKTEEIDHLYNTLEGKIEENRDLVDQIKSLQLEERTTKDDLADLANKNKATQDTLNTVKKQSAELMSKINDYENLINNYDNLKQAHDQVKSEKERLQCELEIQFADIKKLERENIALNKHSQNLMTHNEELDNALINARNEQLRTFVPQQNPYADVIKEIDDMKKEKLVNHKKIRDLLDKLEESENIISNLSEEVLARDDKIAILENHINSLEDEVRRLHSNLAEVVGTGEQMKDSYHKIDQSLYKLEAHHSKATHNMKMELAKLQNENAKLEKQLSVTKQKSDESFRDRHKYASQIIHLQNEREIIITDIKQLELETVGDSLLSPEKCSTENVLSSLDKIRRCLHAKNSKTNILEQTILKVQTSSQLLLSKADEAKRLLEKEQQKIISEKEEAVTARLNMEKQLMDVKENLEKQTSHDKGIIKDLQAEILNQKLIIDKINKSRQDYITKLQEELQSLQNLYTNSKETVNELQNKVQNLEKDKSNNVSIMNKINENLEQKAKEVAELQKSFEALKQKPTRTLGIQINPRDNLQSMSSQTDKVLQYSGIDTTVHNVEPPLKETNKHDIQEEDITDINILKINKPHQDKIVTELYPNQNQQSINEVQILTANVEPTFDFVKSSYLNYKLKQLSTGRLEQFSITDITNNMKLNNTKSLLSTQSLDEVSYKTYGGSMSPSPHLVDIYNRQSMHTESSNIANTEVENPITIERETQSTTKLSVFTGFGLTNDIFESESNVYSNKYDSNAFFESASGKSTDKDLFVIYQDSESNNIDNDYNNKENWQSKGQPEILVETVNIQPAKQDKDHDKKLCFRNIQKTAQYTVEDEFHEAEDNLIKFQLNIDLPRVGIDSHSITATSGDKKSLDSYALHIYPPPKALSKKYIRKEKLLELAENKQNVLEPKIANEDNSESHHKLSRVGENFLLFKNKNNKEADTHDSGKIEEPGNFGLEYILESVQREVDPANIKELKSVRKSRSDEMFNQIRKNSSPSECKESNFSHSSNKCIDEQNILVKLDSTDDYEKKIQYLTKALQNIEKVYKKKIEAIKIQYDANIKSIINEHNQGVKSIQSLHEETLQDIMKIHENEVENLRSMSIEAMRKADKLEKENHSLKFKMQEFCCCIDEEPVKITSSEIKSNKLKSRGDTRMLTKTNVEAFNVKPKVRTHGPCTCSLDINISDTIRDIFEQVDVDQRKLAEHAYLKYIANKILNGNVETLDSQELSFLHLKVCRTWKSKLSKEEALQNRIDSLETELLNKQRHAQEHIAELDRKVAEERRRLQEVREAVCRNSPNGSRYSSPDKYRYDSPPHLSPTAPEKSFDCKCKSGTRIDVGGRRSAGDLLPGMSCAGQRSKRAKPESRAVPVKLDLEERREKKLYNDEPPTRLRRAHDRPARTHKK